MARGTSPGRPVYGAQPGTRRFETVQIPGIYGNHVPYDRGTDVRTPDIEPGQGAHQRDWNAAMILPTGETITMWVHEVEASYSLNGVTAQSRRVRQFFPRHLVQPSIIIRGIVPNNYQYNRLASFIRMSQYWALNASSAVAEQRIGGGRILERHYADGTAIPTTQLQIKAGNIRPAPTHKGPHSPWVVEGYIKTVQAGATRFEFAKEFEFEFIIAWSTVSPTGLFQDSAARGSRILPWMDIFKKYHFQGTKKHDASTDQSDQVVSFVNGLLTGLADLVSLFDGDN